MDLSLFHWLALLLGLGLALLASLHILLNKRDPCAAALWLLVVWFVPFLGFGFVIYWTLGVNRVSRKAKRRLRRSPLFFTSPPFKKAPKVSPALQPLNILGNHIAQQPLYPGNQISPLYQGDQAYPAMLQAIGNARRSLALCSYIFDPDEVGRQFLKYLCEAARRGVKVKLLVDGMGAWGLGPKVKKLLTEVGGQMASFWPRGRWLRHPGINLRNHRKLLILDGKLGFTGGMNISKRHLALNGAQPKSRDVHFQIQGPVVRQMVDAFAQDWELSTGERLHGADWYPALDARGPMATRGLASGPDQDFEKIYELVLGALRAARKSVEVMTPYFIPDRAILLAMRSAARSGIKLRLMLPKETDYRAINWASRGYWWELVEAGVELWELGGEFIHSKLLIVDKHWVLLGSANLDSRSFRLNFEFNLEVYSSHLAQQMLAYMDAQLSHAHRVDFAYLQKESFLKKLRNQSIKLFSPFL